MQRRQPTYARYLVMATAVLMLALAFRAYRLADIPFGWHPDEATKALLARDVDAGKYFPAYFSAYTGRDALYVYLEAGAFLLVGESTFAARLVSLSVSLIAVAGTISLGSMLFTKRVGLLAGALLSLSLWHLIASRNAYRAVIQPTVQLMVLLFLWQALRGSTRRARTHAAIAGFWLGVSQYTYPAARFFPLVVAAFVLAALLFRRDRLRRSGSALLLVVLVSALVFLPLGIHFLRNPWDLYGRAAQVSVFSPAWSGGHPWQRLWRSVVETARMFTVWGDINYRFNIAGQPVFGPIAGVLFYAGLLIAAWRAVIERGWKRIANVVLFAWSAIMLLPMILSAESLPYYQRAIGALPALYYFPALALDVGAAALGNVSGRGGKRRKLASLLPLLAVLAYFAWSSVQLYDDYFHRWHTAVRNDDDRRVAMVYVADYLQQQGPFSNLYISTQYPQHPTLAWLAPEIYDQVHWFDATQSLPLPPAGTTATYILLEENAPQPMLLQRAPSLQETETVLDRFGRPVFTVYDWTGTSWPMATNDSTAVWSWEVDFAPGDPQGLRHEIALPVSFGDVVAFAGHDREPSELAPSDTLQLVLYWRLLSRPERPYTMFAHLLNADGQVVAGYDANTYATAFWREGGGELLLSYFPLSVPDNLPAGLYQLEIGVYNQPSGERLPVYADGEAVADRLLLEPIVVKQAERP